MYAVDGLRSDARRPAVVARWAGLRHPNAAPRLAELHPSRSDFEWKVGYGGCSARRLVARGEAGEIVCKLVTGLCMGSL